MDTSERGSCRRRKFGTRLLESRVQPSAQTPPLFPGIVSAFIYNWRGYRTEVNGRIMSLEYYDFTGKNIGLTLSGE